MNQFLNPSKNEIHSIFGDHTFQSNWSIFITSHCIGKLTSSILNPSTQHLIDAIVFILKEKATFVFLGVSEIRDLEVFCKDNTTIQWIGLIFDDVVESLDTLIKILSFVTWYQLARLVFETTCIFILK